jgi:uncharacterized protein YdhG (YjbR/CyaY superfamily)
MRVNDPTTRRQAMAEKIETVDDYLASLSPEQRAVLGRIREVIREAAPEAEERISYRIPLYRQHGDVVGFAAFKNHLSLFVTNSAVRDEFADELAEFDVKHTTVRFSISKPLPDDLIRRIVKYRLAENEARASA